MLAIYGGSSVLVAVVLTFIARTLVSSPDSKIKVPNKAYFLAPSRRESTIEFLGTRLRAYACATQVLLLLVFDEVFRANVDTTTPFRVQRVLSFVGFFLFFVGIEVRCPQLHVLQSRRNVLAGVHNATSLCSARWCDC